MASMIAFPQIPPGRMSLGAIQHRTSFRSRVEQTASAMGLAGSAYDIKTSCAMGVAPSSRGRSAATGSRHLGSPRVPRFGGAFPFFINLLYPAENTLLGRR